MSETKHTYTNLTAGEIINELKDVDPNTEIHIERKIFYRWKWRGDNLLALELSDTDPVFEKEFYKSRRSE